MRLGENLLLISTVMFSVGCSLSVKDASPSPPQYANTAPIGFPIKARAQWGPLMEQPAIQTAIVNIGTEATNPFNSPVSMTRSVSDTALFEGAFDPSIILSRLFTGCGFRVRHNVKSRFLWIIPRHATSDADISGNDYAQHVTVGSFWETITVVFPTRGGSVTTTSVGGSLYFFITNGYSQTLTVSSIKFKCGGQDCGPADAPFLIGFSNLDVPVDLACGASIAQNFQCSPQAVAPRPPLTVEIVTSRGTIITQIDCVEITG